MPLAKIFFASSTLNVYLRQQHVLRSKKQGTMNIYYQNVNAQVLFKHFRFCLWSPRFQPPETFELHFSGTFLTDRP